MLDFQDQVVVITGGTRGIGFETARAFLERGAQVIIFGSRAETVEKATAELREEGYEVAGFHPDLTNFVDVSTTFQKIQQKYGHIDVLVNNAGISAASPLEATSDQDFARVIELNLNAIFHTCKAVVPQMKEQGHGVILNTSSFVSFYGQPSGVGYPASKSAVNGLTRSLARELAPHGIRVNAVAPGITNTDMVASLPDEMLEPLIATIPLGRIGQPRDIANAFLFLASDLASYITGVVLPVDGAAHN